jgi:hypothetical protein
MILVPEADRPSQGWTGEAAMCLSAGAKKQSGEESGTAADAFECARARDRGEKRGSGGGHRVEGGNGEKEGARARRGMARVADGRGWRRCRATVEGSGTRAAWT